MRKVTVFTILVLSAAAGLAVLYSDKSRVSSANRHGPVEGHSLVELKNSAWTDSDGPLSIPASGFSGASQSDKWQWSVSGADRKDYADFVRVKPAHGTMPGNSRLGELPRLDYNVTFSSPGFYYIWFHGNASTDEAKLDIGLDGTAIHSSDNVHGFGPKGRRYHWRIPWPIQRVAWSRDTSDRVPAHFEIIDTGTYDLNVWLRSFDMTFDKMVIAPDVDYEPVRAGPVFSSLMKPQLRPPTLSRTSGLFEGRTQLTLSATGPDASVFFTNDGSDPTVSETAVLYDAPIVVSETTQVRAVAVSETARTSDETTARLTRVTCRPTRIMPVGDSITLGIYGPVEDGPRSGLRGGYRAPLYHKLRNSGYAVDFVGSLRDGYDIDPVIDPDHEGRDGWTTGQIADHVYMFLSNNPADVILLHAGTNGATPDVSEVARTLDEIDRFEYDTDQATHVIVAKIINRRKIHDDTAAYNDNLEDLVARRKSNGDNISIVDMENALNYPDDLHDKLHPNASGYTRMSDVWFEAVTNSMTPCN